MRLSKVEQEKHGIELADYIRAIPEDVVNNPLHYALFGDGTEAIDVIRAYLTEEEFRGYCKGNCLKYRLRVGNKDDVHQELEKSNVYQTWEKETYEK